MNPDGVGLNLGPWLKPECARARARAREFTDIAAKRRPTTSVTEMMRYPDQRMCRSAPAEKIPARLYGGSRFEGPLIRRRVRATSIPISARLHQQVPNGTKSIPAEEALMGNLKEDGGEGLHLSERG